MMPTLHIKLSALQMSVVTSNHNLLCLGRSGTGKTTTSVLRLFAQEVLYTILKKQDEKKQRDMTEKKREEKIKQRMMIEESKEEPKI
jgi:hypothetical protein